MARKLRLEFPDALYHVINRGNYRSDVFASDKTKAAFELCLFEACTKSNWILHDFVVMRNHYHLALKTPDGNLVAGMQWLQATFACRFNHFRNERGHLFQGRYKALLVEDGDALAQVCRYIHLNPVRAGICTVAELQEYRYGSYWYLWRTKQRPQFLRPQTALVQSAGLKDNSRGWDSYAQDLALEAAKGSTGKNRSYISMSNGWCLGSDAFRDELIQKHGLNAEVRAWGSPGATAMGAQKWSLQVECCLKLLRRNDHELSIGPKSARWKVAVATFLKERSQASNSWLAQRLHFDRPVYLSRLVSAAKRSSPPSPELSLLRDKCKT